MCHDRGIVCSDIVHLTTFDHFCDKVNLCRDILYLPCVVDHFMCCSDKVLKCRDKFSMNFDLLVSEQSLLYRDIPPLASYFLFPTKNFETMFLGLLHALCCDIDLIIKTNFSWMS